MNFKSNLRNNDEKSNWNLLSYWQMSFPGFSELMQVWYTFDTYLDNVIPMLTERSKNTMTHCHLIKIANIF